MLVDKPAGWTSQDAVTVVRRALGIRSAGHTGTLDPFATGLLLVLTGRATRLARFFEGERKVYVAEVALGTATDTDDATGAVTVQRTPAAWPTRDQVEAAVAGMVGTHGQRPPAYSAKHVDGVRSYRLARRGEAVELPETAITVYELAVTAWTPERFTLRAVVGKGTYLRAIARDLGAALAVPAHCATLRRTAIGPFTVEAAADPRALTEERLLAPAAMLRHLPAATMDGEAVAMLRHGRAVAQDAPREGYAALLAHDDGRLVAVAEGGGGMWRPVVVMESA